MKLSLLLLVISLNIYLIVAFPAATNEKSAAAAAKGADGKANKPVAATKNKGKENPWKVPNAAQKKIFNDYKAIIRTKLVARRVNISNSDPLEAVKYGLQAIEKTSVHHFLIKLPDAKYAHAMIAISKDAKKSTLVNEKYVSVRRTVYENLAEAEKQ